MRRMLTSRQIEILDSMTEEVFESGVWEISSGKADETLSLKNLEIGYQYKIYLNVTTQTPQQASVIRLETELGLSQDYYNFLSNEKYMEFALGDFEGGTNFRLLLTQDQGRITTELAFDDALTNSVKFRYLITRHKLYI